MAVSFALESTDNRAFQEAIAAVSRTVDEAIIQPTDNALEIRAVEPSNSYSVDATIPLSVFDQSSAFSGDQFGVDIDALATTLGDINKTSGVLLTDQSGGGFTVEDRSTGDVTEFEFIDPDGMRNPPDLAGSVGMMDYDTVASVPRGQFRRVVRVADKMGSDVKVAVGVGPRDGTSGPMAFKMLCEPDTDTLIGAPDAEFEGATQPREPAAGLYSHEFLDSVSLGAPDRNIDVKIGIEGDGMPLRVSFPTGGDVPAQVIYYIAPRLGSGASDAVADLKSADVTSAPVASPDFIAGMGGQEADTFVNGLTTVADERRVMFTRSGVESRVVDPGNVLMSIVQAEPAFFDTYREVGGFPTEPVGVPTRRLGEYYSLWLSRQELTLSYDSSTRFMGLTHPIFSIKMATIDPDAMRQEPNIPTNLTFDASADVDQSGLSQAINSISTSAAGDDSREVGVVITADSGSSSGMYLADDLGGRAKVDGGMVRGEALGLFSGKFIKQVGGSLVTSSSTPATVRLGNDFPLATDAPNSNETFSHTTVLAPKQRDSRQDVLDAAPIEDGMDGAAVDLSFYKDDTGGVEVGFPDDISEESPAEQARKRKFQSYPVTVEVSTGFSDDSIKIENVDDLAVDDDTIDAVREEASSFVDGVDIGSRETVGEVTFDSDTEFSIDYVDAQPTTDRRIATDDGVVFRTITSDTDNYLYYSERDSTPARYQMALRAVADDNTYGVKLGYKYPTAGEIQDEEWLIDGLDDILDAYAELEGYIEESDIQEIVEQAGVDVELTTRESEDELEAVVDNYLDYTLEVSPREYDDNFYASVNGTGALLPDAEFRGDITVESPDSPSGEYLVRYELSYTVKGPTYGAGATISSPVIDDRTVGTSNTRSGVTRLVETAFEQLREYGTFFAREMGESTQIEGLPSPREGDAESIRNHTQAFLPAGVTRASLEQLALSSSQDIPTSLTGVSGIGPARAEGFTEAGIEDVIDVMAILSSTRPTFWLGQIITDLPDDPKQNIREAAGDLWGMFVWPERAVPGDPNPDLPDEQIAVGGDTEPDGQPLPDNVESGRWDVFIVAHPDNDYGDRFEAVILADGDRRQPDLELPDESLEAAEDSVEYGASGFEDGDVVAAGAFTQDARGPPRVASFTHDPGVELLKSRTTDADGNLTVTADDGWTAIAPVSLRDADEGDLQRGFTISPVRDPAPEGLGLGSTVGWDAPGGRQYAYVELSSVPYFVYGLDPDDNSLSGLGASDDPAQEYSISLYRAPDGDEIIGYDPETEPGPNPPEPVFRSEYDDEYELFPFFRSKESVTDLIGETVLGRGTDGQIRETEIVDEVPDAAGVIAEEMQFPDGRYFIPASSEHDNSTFEIIGTPKDQPDDEPVEEAADDDFGRTIEGTFSDEVIEEGVVEEEVVDEPPQDIPSDIPDDSATIGISPRDLEGTGWVHIERDLSDPAEILLLNDDRTIGLHGRRVELTDQTVIEWFGIQYSTPVGEGETPDSRSPSADRQVRIGDTTDTVDRALDTIRETPVTVVEKKINEPEDTGPAEAEVEETIESINSAISDAGDVVDRARDAEVMGRSAVGRVNQTITALDSQLREIRPDPTAEDIENAEARVEELRERIAAAEEVVEEADGEAEDEPMLGETDVESIVDNATVGVDVDAVIIEDVLQRIRMTPTGSISIDGRDQIVASLGESRVEMVENAVDRWSDAVDLSQVNIDDVNRLRQTINETTPVELPMLEVVPEDTEPEPEPAEVEQAGNSGLPDDIQAALESALTGMGLPSTTLPAEFSLDDELLVARPNVPDAWESIIRETPPFARQDESQSQAEFVADYAELLDESMTGPGSRRFDTEQIRDALGVGDEPEPEPEREEEPDRDTTVSFRPDLEEPFTSMLTTAIQQDIPKEERSMVMAETLEESSLFVSQVPGKFTDAVVGLEYPRGGVSGGGRQFAEDVMVEIGGSLGDQPKSEMAVPGFVFILSVERPLIRIDDAWEAFVELVQIADPNMDGFDRLSQKLDAIVGTTAFQIENDRVNWSDAFLEPNEIGEIATRSGEFWANVLSSMKEASKAWWAAQRVQEVAKAGNRQIQQILEDEIGSDPARGADRWYLKNAWEIYLDYDDFDPVQYTQDWHEVFRAGESKQKAERRRGEVDLDELRRRAGRAPEQVPEEPEPEPAAEPEPVREPEPEPQPEPDGDKTVNDLKSDILDRM